MESATEESYLPEDKSEERKRVRKKKKRRHESEKYKDLDLGVILPKAQGKVAPMTFDIDKGTVNEDKDKVNVPLKAADVDIEEFMRICEQKDVERMRTVLFSLKRDEARHLVNSYSRFRPLHKAARYACKPGALEAVKLLLEYGAEVNGLDIDGQTALHHASSVDYMTKDQGGDINVAPLPENSVVHYLASRGADVNKSDKVGHTPIAMAIMRLNDIITRDLAHLRTVDLEKATPNGARPIHLAAYFKNKFAMQLLLERGASVASQDGNKRNAVHYLSWQEKGLELLGMTMDWAETHGGKEALTQLLSMPDVDKKVPLHLSVEAKCVPTTKLLIERGADIEAHGCHSNSTPLHLAAAAGDEEVVELLLEHGARDDALDAHKNTPLHSAAATDHAHIVQVLINKNEELLKKRNAQNLSAVLVAARYGSPRALIRLLKLGSNVYDRSQNKSILRLAVDNGKDDTVEAVLEFCLEKGLLNLLIRSDDDGNTPLHIAAKIGYIRCVRIMCKKRFALLGLKSSWYNKKRQTPLHFAAMAGHVAIVKELLAVGYFDIDAEDEDGFSPIERAAEAGQNQVVQTLIKAHANIQTSNDKRLDLLHFAAERGWSDTCAIVIRNGADVNSQQHGLTALHLAAKHGHVACINLLIDRGADVTARDQHGENCLDIAIRHGCREAVKAMIECDQWRDMFSNAVRDPHTGSIDTPMRKLIRSIPDIAGLALQRCTTTNGKQPESEDLEVTYHYDLLDDVYNNYEDKNAIVYGPDHKVLPTAMPYTSNKALSKNNHPLKLMVDHNCEELLKSPLVASLLEHKWNTYGFYLYYIKMMMHALLLCLLTAYVSTTKAPYSFFNENRDNCTAESCSNIASHCLSGREEEKVSQAAMQYIIIVLSALFVILEVVQLVNERQEYLSWENLMQMVLYVCAVLAVSDVTDCVRQHRFLREPWQWQLAAVAILLAWLEMMLLIRKVPRFGIFVVMFTDVLFTFLQFLPVFALLLVGFGLAFAMLFGNQERFDGSGYALVSTFIMMVGEMDYQDIFFNSGDAQRGTKEYAEVALYYKTTSYVIFVLFVTCMTIITMNLLIGLAVDDIKAVQEQAELKRLAMRAELALSVESLIPMRFRRRYIVRCHTVRPNEKLGTARVFLERSRTFFQGKEKEAPISPQDEILERILRRLETMRVRVDRLEGIEKLLVQQTRMAEKQQQIIEKALSHEDGGIKLTHLVQS